LGVKQLRELLEVVGRARTIPTAVQQAEQPPNGYFVEGFQFDGAACPLHGRGDIAAGLVANREGA